MSKNPMGYIPNETPLVRFLCAIAFVVLGVDVFFRARVAEHLHTNVQTYRFGAWMTPGEAYIASALCLLASIAILAPLVRGDSKK